MGYKPVTSSLVEMYLITVTHPRAQKKKNNYNVKRVTSEGNSKWRGSYRLFSPVQQAAIGKYASLHAFSFARGVDHKWTHPNWRPLNVCLHAVNHAKFKTTKIYSLVILVNYMKICSNENLPLYGILILTHKCFFLH